MNRTMTILAAAAVLVLLAGIGLAIVQPGDLGGDDETALQGDRGEPGDGTTTSTTTAGDGAATTSTTAGDGAATTSTTAGDGAATTSTTAGDGAATTSTTGGDDSTTTAPTTAPGDTTTTTGRSESGVGGSGLGSSGTADPSDTRDGLADTGGESLLLLGAGAALGVAGVVARRRTAPR